MPPAAGEVHPGDYCQCLERAEMVREGTDVTIFCYSRMRYVVMQVGPCCCLWGLLPAGGCCLLLLGARDGWQYCELAMLWAGRTRAGVHRSALANAVHNGSLLGRGSSMHCAGAGAARRRRCRCCAPGLTRMPGFLPCCRRWRSWRSRATTPRWVLSGWRGASFEAGQAAFNALVCSRAGQHSRR